jgi:hypothetical protein
VVPPSNSALQLLALGRVGEGSISSLASSATTVTAASLQQSCQALQLATTDLQGRLNGLVREIEEEEAERNVKLQHLSGLGGDN